MKPNTLISSLAAASVLALAVLPATNTVAQSVTASFTTRIYYQNPNNAVATAVINFYPELSGTADSVVVNLPNIPAFGSGEVWLGSVNLNGGGTFKGSAVLSADQNIVAASSQVPTSATVNQLMSTAFTGSDATSSLYLSTFLHNWGYAYSTFSVQNTDAETINYGARFFDSGNPVPIATVTGQIPANASAQFSAWVSSTINSQFQTWVSTVGSTGLKGAFNGSVVVTATLLSNGQPAHVVGIAEERYSSNDRGYAFEAIPQSAGATTVYIPTALCAFGGATTYFAVQNLSSTTAATYTVQYLDTTGAAVATQTVANVGAGSKKGFNPCANTTPALATLNGSAVVSGGQPAAVIGKAQDTANFTTAYLGQGVGSQRIAIPFVRWNVGTTGLRAFVAVQNIGSAIAAGQITLTYYNADGTTFRSCSSIAATAQNAKVASNPGQGANTATVNCNGAAPTGDWAGSVIIAGPTGAQLISINRSQGWTGTATNAKVTEDINGVFIP